MFFAPLFFGGFVFHLFSKMGKIYPPAHAGSIVNAAGWEVSPDHGLQSIGILIEMLGKPTLSAWQGYSGV